MLMQSKYPLGDTLGIKESPLRKRLALWKVNKKVVGTIYFTVDFEYYSYLSDISF